MNRPPRFRAGRSTRLLFAVLSFASAWLCLLGPWPAVALRTGQGLEVHVHTPKLLPAARHQQMISVVAETSPSAKCLATVEVKATKTRLMSLVADRSGRVGWRWLILPSSPSGTWHMVVSCHKGKRHARGTTSVLVVTRSKYRKGKIGDPTSLRAVFGEPAGKGGGVCGPFEPGQCTCLAYRKRPDVYNTAVAHGVPVGGTRAAGPDFYVWDGEQWLVNAQRAGMPTGSQPVAGALVVWGVPNSAAYGHVAYVEAATSPTHVLVAECNYDFEGHCRTIWENPQAAPHLQGYVYGGPAGNGPAGSSPVATIQGRIGVLYGNGTFAVKEGGLGAGFVTEAEGAQDAVLSGNRIGVLYGDGTVAVKEGGLSAGFVTEAEHAQGVALSGNRIGVLYGNGTFAVKEGGLGAGFVTEAEGAHIGFLPVP